MTEAKNYNKYLISIVKGAVGTKKGKVLDFGAGSGTYADMLKEEGIVAECLEPDKVLQDTLKAKGYKVVADAKALKPNSYDVIYALNVFEHIEDDNASFALLANALTKNGRIVIYVPAFQGLYSSMDKLVGHYRRYRKDRLRKMADDNSMKIVKLQYCDPVGYAAATAFKASGNKNGVISARSVKLYDRVAFPVSRLLEPVFKHVAGKNVVLVAQNNGKAK